MKKVFLVGLFTLPVILLILWQAPGIYAQPTEEMPAIDQPLVREGSFALRLAAVLETSTTSDEVEAETSLANVGIIPRNGWIAEYPVTPDIIAELQGSLQIAADADKLAMNSDEAQKRFAAVTKEFGLAIKPSVAGKPSDRVAADAVQYPDTMEITDYYNDEGPPVVTYYAPPPDYVYLYNWVPSPFWCADIWFPGFFVLRDFHRVSVVNSRVVVISNHFNDLRNHRAFRVDPVARFNGRTFAGIGAPRNRAFIATGVQRSDRVIFNSPRVRRGMVTGPARGTVTAPMRRGEQRSFRPQGVPMRSFTPRGTGRRVAPTPGTGTFRERGEMRR